MSDMLKVNDVAVKYGISKRTIKYYEEIGILKSRREEGSNYRVYDPQALDRLEKILILRRLNFTLFDICKILDSDSAQTQLIFHRRLDELKDEINALASMQSIVEAFLEMSSSVGIDHVNIYQLLNEQIYIHKKVERVINMSKYEGDLLKIEIGTGLIPDANTIIENIKVFRCSLSQKQGIQIPLVRLIDSEDIAGQSYRILVKNNVVIDRVLESHADTKWVSGLIRDLEEVITLHTVE